MVLVTAMVLAMVLVPGMDIVDTGKDLLMPRQMLMLGMDHMDTAVFPMLATQAILLVLMLPLWPTPLAMVMVPMVVMVQVLMVHMVLTGNSNLFKSRLATENGFSSMWFFSNPFMNLFETTFNKTI